MSEARPAAHRVTAVLAVAAVWLWTAPRVVPTTFGDHGTFMSVADRLRAGDRLYADVWDNKDPLHYYVLAAARSALPLGDLVVELLWLAVACAAATAIARTAIGTLGRGADRDNGSGAGSLPLLVGWAGTPLVIAGAAYVPGMSHLPGTALTLAALALALRGRWVHAGVVAGLLVVTKLVLLPVAGLALLGVLTRNTAARSLLRLGAGAASTLATAAALLAVRGELAPLLDVQAHNVRYANGPIVDSPYGGFVGHLMAVVTEDGRGGILASLALITAVGLWCRPATSTGQSLVRALWLSLAGALVVLGLTGFWPHHAQVFAVPVVLGLVVAAATAATAATATTATAGTEPAGDPAPAPHQIAVGLLLAFALGGAVHPYWNVEAVRGLPAALRAQSEASPEARDLLTRAPTGSYARLGANDVTAHARGLEAWDLACPRFQLYSFDPAEDLAAAADCALRTDAVLVDGSFAPADPDAPGRDTWDAFVASTRTRLARTHECTTHGWGQLCLRRGT